MAKIKIIIVDDHFLVRVGLRKTILASDFGLDIDIVAEAGDAAEFYSILESGIEVDMVLLDIRLPDESGIEIAKRLNAEYPDLKILILSAETDDDVIESIFELNVGGFVSKGVTPANLCRAIESVMDGVKYFGKDIALLMHNIKVAKSEVEDVVFTSKELEVLQLSAQGMYSKEIAEKLGMSSKTVSVHKSHIFKKLGINNSVELVHYALKMGFIKG